MGEGGGEVHAGQGMVDGLGNPTFPEREVADICGWVSRLGTNLRVDASNGLLVRWRLEQYYAGARRYVHYIARAMIRYIERYDT